MSTIHDEIEPSYNFFDDNNLSDKFLEENNFNESNNNSISLNEDFFDNDKFLNNFMKIDYSFELSSTNNNNNNNKINNESNFTINLNKENNNNNNIFSNSTSINSLNQNSNLQKKTYREKNRILFDELTKITYYEKDDPIAFKKAKKRIQNRESALRMKKLNLNQKKSIEEEIKFLKEENTNLKEENFTLKKEKNFLIEQIKCMQNILKESNIDLITLINNNNNNKKINQKKITQQILNYDSEKIFYDGSKQIIKGKLFNVFTICLLSILYIAGDNNYSEENNNNLSKKHNTIGLNSLNENKINKKFNFWNIISKIILFVIFCLIIPWIKTIYNFIILIKKKNKKMK